MDPQECPSGHSWVSWMISLQQGTLVLAARCRCGQSPRSCLPMIGLEHAWPAHIDSTSTRAELMRRSAGGSRSTGGDIEPAIVIRRPIGAVRCVLVEVDLCERAMHAQARSWAGTIAEIGRCDHHGRGTRACRAAMESSTRPGCDGRAFLGVHRPITAGTSNDRKFAQVAYHTLGCPLGARVIPLSKLDQGACD